MPAGYDAQAIAEAMGIAFVRSLTQEAAPAQDGPARGARSNAGGDSERFRIKVDDGSVLVVEIGDGDGGVRIGPFRRTLEKERFRPPSPALIEKAVEVGLPRSALRHVAEKLAGEDKAKIAALEWGVVPKTTLLRRERQLSSQESERTERVARLFVHARRALGSDEEARQFMTTPHSLLDGRSPIDAARTDLGTRRTEQVLNALEYGLAL
ncbi:DUF2384 domain-containing protein [Roseomonas sp. NAR14]|uniref:DUF2384 domain-containing protein n=1 Tax=Roseomonas acroporae TaxID=2937791 RepID=A0A9X1YBY2_9PROT|nr:antitoxin Xre/MbcA/ParS toxin-binding domain-containing protein [Roseomonas acroporae]MCK8786170.1 DUF2384 domain-containing protein [Roseomonas acroporae]